MPKPVADMTAEDAKSEIARIDAEIARHNRLYHDQDEPEIDDGEFDELRRTANAIREAFPSLEVPFAADESVGSRGSLGF